MEQQKISKQLEEHNRLGEKCKDKMSVEEKARHIQKAFQLSGQLAQAQNQVGRTGISNGYGDWQGYLGATITTTIAACGSIPFLK